VNTSSNGQHIARSRHLEELANAAKRYTFREILDVTEAVAAELENISISGGGESSSTELILPTVPSTVDGGFWYELTDNVPMLWLRQGNYQYRFNYDMLKFVGDTSNALVAYLTFDNSATAYAGGNEWTAVGSPYIAQINAIRDNALQLNGSSYLQCVTPLTFGERDLTFDCYACIDSSTPNFSALFYANDGVTSNNRVGEFHFGNNGQVINLGLGDAAGTYSQDTIGVTNMTNTLHHFALTYTHANTTIRVFVDGNCLYTKTNFAIPRMARMCYIGSNKHGLGQFRMKVTIDQLRFFDGVALWTENFTPPTAADYE